MKRNGSLAIIPARGGSKALPNKNILLCNGKPLIEWTILAALEAKPDRVVVTSDSAQILEIASKYKEVILDKRPYELAKDDTSSEDVVKYVLKKYDDKYKYIILLQPTSPCRTGKHIIDAVKMFSNGQDYECLISSKEVSNKFLKSFIKINNKVKTIGDESFPFLRRQDLPRLYLSNGAIYICNIDYFNKNCRLFSPEKTALFEMSELESIDIDSINDLERASLQLKKNKNENCSNYRG